ncbi:MAG: hypothetical protein IT375_14890 [Polyangiaceae bacterium]|nr:hypothetical protein [Polyangiaceae bacterium]
MSKTLVLLWLGTSAAQVSHEPELESWSRARWVELAPPASDSPAGLRHDDQWVAKIEEWLDQARVAASSLDDATARERLADVERTLRRHPALPQAAWLLAEALHVQAALAARTAPADRAQLVARAVALEGRRAPAFGEAEGPAGGAPPVLQVTLANARGSDQIYFDGARVGRRLDLVAGEHHVRVLRRERVVWGGWVTVERSGDLSLPVQSPVPCSLDDVDGVRLDRGRVVVPAGVLCSGWAVARPRAKGGIEIASCRGSSCGPLIPWKRHDGAIYSGPPQPPPEPGFPAWATWALVGAGAAVIGAGVAWQAGAFDDPKPGATRFEFYGPGPEQKQWLSPSVRARR